MIVPQNLSRAQSSALLGDAQNNGAGKTGDESAAALLRRKVHESRLSTAQQHITNITLQMEMFTCKSLLGCEWLIGCYQTVNYILCIHSDYRSRAKRA